MERVASGITLYNPEMGRLNDNIRSLLKQTEHVYIVDNASSNTEDFKNNFSGDSRITLIENKENAGIAKALNQMCTAALSDGYDWILTLDQDSLPEEEMIKKYSRYTDIPDAAIISPHFVDDNEPDIINSESFKPYEIIDRCNTSASLVNLSAYKEVGGFDDDMFIDYVDNDFCATLREHGYIIIRDNQAILYHRLGCAKEITFFIPAARILGIKKWQKPMFTYNHPPFRTYYFIRNIRYCVHKHPNTMSRKYETKVCIRWMLLKLMFEKHKTAQLKAAFRGYRDAKKMIKKLNMNKQRAE